MSAFLFPEDPRFPRHHLPPLPREDQPPPTSFSYPERLVGLMAAWFAVMMVTIFVLAFCGVFGAH